MAFNYLHRAGHAVFCADSGAEISGACPQSGIGYGSVDGLRQFFGREPFAVSQTEPNA